MLHQHWRSNRRFALTPMGLVAAFLLAVVVGVPLSIGVARIVERWLP